MAEVDIPAQEPSFKDAVPPDTQALHEIARCNAHDEQPVREVGGDLKYDELVSMLACKTATDEAAWMANFLRGAIKIPDAVKLRVWLWENGNRGRKPDLIGEAEALYVNPLLRPAKEVIDKIGWITKHADLRDQLLARDGDVTAAAQALTDLKDIVNEMEIPS